MLGFGIFLLITFGIGLSLLDLYPDLKSIDNILLCVYTFFSNVGIIVSYLVIYIVIRNLYLKFDKDNKANSENTRNNLNSLLILFISISVVYIIRIIRDIQFIMDVQDSDKFNQLPIVCSKTILLLGVCISLYRRLRVAVRIMTANQTVATPNTRTQNIDTAPSMGELEIDENEKEEVESIHAMLSLRRYTKPS